MDAELEALARAPGPADVARDAAVAAKARAAAAARGEPRSWDDLSDGEQEGELHWKDPQQQTTAGGTLFLG